MQPDIIVLLAGTNDLGAGRSPERTARGVAECVRALLARFGQARVVVLGLLPRGDGGARGFAQIAAVNAQLKRLADQPRVRFFDCTPAFVDATGAVRTHLFDPDLLHLAAAGYAAWARILSKAPIHVDDVTGHRNQS